MDLMLLIMDFLWVFLWKNIRESSRGFLGHKMMKNEILDEVDLFKGVQQILNRHDMRHYMRVACHACESHLASHPLPEKGSGWAWHATRHANRMSHMRVALRVAGGAREPLLTGTACDGCMLHLRFACHTCESHMAPHVVTERKLASGFLSTNGLCPYMADGSFSKLIRHFIDSITVILSLRLFDLMSMNENLSEV